MTDAIEALLKALGGYRAGASAMCHCPVHEDGTPSLSVDPRPAGGLLVHCHAGCSQRIVVAALTERGLWCSSQRSHVAVSGLPMANQGKRQSAALRIWETAISPQGTLVERYLASRCLTLPLTSPLRFVAGLRHRSGKSLPAMIGLVTHGATNAPLGVHRTWLRSDGSGKADIGPNKMMLGPCRGGAVRLAPLSTPLMVGEGIETTLAAIQSTGYGGWAALSTSGLRVLELPSEARDIIILADGDDPGVSASNAAATRWTKQGRRVRIASSPRGFDLNDLLIGLNCSRRRRK